ncbi:MAG: hypothetical protein IJ391_03065 [Clostridia bacterium]|nr:hypothetical protein [Clostridia bacterium]
MITADFIGNNELIFSLKRDAASGKTPHAIILEGPYGSGKKTLAKYLAMLLACESSPEVCSKCSACRKILADNSPDVITISPGDGKVQIGVDSVRFVRSDVYIKPNDNDHKVYIIESADKMTHEAQNAFLKVLEEPPEYAVFILLCESSDALLVTVKSRATVYSTERFSSETITKHLLEISPDANKLHADSPDAFKLAVMSANGSIGRALENIEPLKAEQTHSLYMSCLELVMMLRKRASAFDILNHLSSLEQNKVFIDSYLLMFESALFDVMNYKLSNNNVCSFFLDEADLEYVAAALTNTFVLEVTELIESCRYSLLSNVNLQTAITALASELYAMRSKF